MRLVYHIHCSMVYCLFTEQHRVIKERESIWGTVGWGPLEDEGPPDLLHVPGVHARLQHGVLHPLQVPEDNLPRQPEHHQQALLILHLLPQQHQLESGAGGQITHLLASRIYRHLFRVCPFSGELHSEKWTPGLLSCSETFSSSPSSCSSSPSTASASSGCSLCSRCSANIKQIDAEDLKFLQHRCAKCQRLTPINFSAIFYPSSVCWFSSPSC